MTTEKNWFSKRRIVIFLLGVCTAVFWVVSKDAKSYSSKLPGAIVEILWLPMIILVFALPLAAIGLWAKDKFDLRSIYFYTFLIGAATVAWLFTRG